MPRFILHIGPHKTGSTHLQTQLFANRQALADAGFHVAALWNASPYKPSQTGLVKRLVTERLHELRPVFAAWEKSAFDSVIISCEDIASLGLGRVPLYFLRDLMAGQPVTIVYYVRRWSDLLGSAWQEYVKQGQTFQLLEVLVHNLRRPNLSRIINIGITLAPFARLFGKANLRLVSYSALVDAKVDLVDHFLDHFCAGVTLDAAPRHRENTSLAPPHIELMRIFNTLQRETGIDSSPLRNFLTLQHTPAPLTTLLDHLAGFVRTIDVDDTDSAVREVLKRNWASYGACAVAPVAEGRFYSPKPTRLSFVDPGYALSPGFALAARRAWQDLLTIANPDSFAGRG